LSIFSFHGFAQPTVSVLYSFPFTGAGGFGSFISGNGANPSGQLLQAADGSLYGTASGGGLNGNFAAANCFNQGCGTVFKIDTSGNFTLLHTFTATDGAFPMAGVIQGKDGYFYGTTAGGGGNLSCVSNGGVTGCGTVFKMDSSGNLTTLHSFNGSDGAFLQGGLIQGSDGNFYGTTSVGGNASCNSQPVQTSGCGTIFKLDSSGNLTVLHAFAGPEGTQPTSALIQAADGNFYGTASFGGSSNNGVVYRMDTNASIVVLHSFSGADGSVLYGGLMQATDGNIYGVAYGGGAYDYGSIFKITTAGTFTLLYSFMNSDGADPTTSLIQATDGNFYGTTLQGGNSFEGTIFRMDRLGNVTFLHSFSGTDGIHPSGGLLQASNGLFYGTTLTGLYGSGLDAGTGNGVIYRLDAGLTVAAAPVILVHGFCEGPEAFGNLKALLTTAGLTVDAFDYSQFTETNTKNFSIEQLATLFALHVIPLVQKNGGRPVDIITHSMGGLVARAWMAGLAAPLQGGAATVPYTGQIRRLILIGTPNYGVAVGQLGEFVFQIRNLVGLSCNPAQAAEQQFGSLFVSRLSDAWESLQAGPLGIAPSNIVYIVGTGDTEPLFECEGSPIQGCSDGLVEISSAVLPSTPQKMIRYVPYRHSVSNLILPLNGLTIAGVTDSSHKSYQVISRFLIQGALIPQCCGSGTLDYSPPYLRGDPNRQTGLLLIRMASKATGRPITGSTPDISFTPAPLTLPFADFNGPSAVTYWGLYSGVYNLNIDARHYEPDELDGVSVYAGRPTVPQTQLLIPSR
jgi:uncharacterized repeat protein (TIGR03803 family)